MTEPIILSNFYGARNCPLCPEVPVNIFNSQNDYVAFFGNDSLPVYGCFFGTYKNLHAWWGIESTIQAPGAKPTFSPFPCSDTCVNPRQTTENCNQEFPKPSQGQKPVTNFPIATSTPTSTLLLSGSPLTNNQPAGARGSTNVPNQAPNNLPFILGGVGGGVVLLFGIFFAVFLVQRRKNNSKMRSIQTSGVPSPATSTATMLQALNNSTHPPPLVSKGTFSRPVNTGQPLLLTGFKVVPSLNLSTFENESEQTVLDEVEQFRDKIHRLASSIISANPEAKLIPDYLVVPKAEETSANIAALKCLISVTIHNTIFLHFKKDYHHTMATILWEKQILHRYTSNPYYRVDSTGKMFLEPELIYAILVDLAEYAQPPDVSKIPDPFLANLINACSSTVMEHLAPLATPLNSTSMFKFAVTRIIKEAVMVTIKLKRYDARYTAFLPIQGAEFDDKRMSRINFGERVAFCWSSGWEKVKDDGEENVVKVLAEVWVN
ncbi:hypothetical protein HK098_003953 [Nowakowskiella sp. JEL0407]|nr:hypothetical protein HK098_003953 [Nowakowskiella sp. JEL0407]